MVNKVTMACLAIVLIGVPFQTSAGVKHLPCGNSYRSEAELRLQSSNKGNKKARHLIDTISQLERKLTVARRELAEELRIHPNVSPDAQTNTRHPAIVSAYISSQLGVNRGSKDGIRLGDPVIIIRRKGSSLTVVADGVVSDVTPSFCAVRLSHNPLGVMIEDEVYMLDNTVSACSIAFIRLDGPDKRGL